MAEDQKKETEPKQKKGFTTGKIITLVVSLVVIIAAVVLLVVIGNKPQTPTAVMECNVNPNIQFVLDQNNNVMQVNYLNSDAEAIFKEVNFNGKSAEDAAQMFVSLATESGFINVSTTGTRVDINISCDKPEDFAAVKTKITNKVNTYFDQNGIIAGAVVDAKANLKEAVQKIGVKASELADKTTAEIMAIYDEQTKELADVAVSLRSGFFDYVDNTLNYLYVKIDGWQATVDDLEQKLKDSNISETSKQVFRAQIAELKEKINTQATQLKELINDKITELKEASKEIYTQAKTTIANAKAAAKTLIDEHKTYFDEHKADVQAKINEYRASLLAQ